MLSRSAFLEHIKLRMYDVRPLEMEHFMQGWGVCVILGGFFL